MSSFTAFAPASSVSFRSPLAAAASPFCGPPSRKRAFAPVTWRFRGARLASPPCMAAERVKTADKAAVDAVQVVRTLTSSRRKEIAGLIVGGPLFSASHLEVDASGEPERFEEWLELGAYLEQLLGAQKCDVRVYQYYLPVFFWVERELTKHQALMRVVSRGADVRPLIVGFSCPQGGGKTTMTTFLSQLLARRGRNTAIASLDDFYIRNADQRALAATHDGNPLLEHRGMPGTHDMPLLLDTLDAIRAFCRVRPTDDGLSCVDDAVRVPRFDKSLHAGRGDRAPESEWPEMRGSVDLVLLEGWCMGFEPVAPEMLVDKNLAPVNAALAEYKPVYDRLDSLLVIQIDDMEWVFGWRMEAERAMRAAGRPGLSDDQVKDFVSRFMPAYKHYAPGLYCRKTAICPDHELHISIDHQRRPVAHLESELEL